MAFLQVLTELLYAVLDPLRNFYDELPRRQVQMESDETGITGGRERIITEGRRQRRRGNLRSHAEPASKLSEMMDGLPEWHIQYRKLK